MKREQWTTRQCAAYLRITPAAWRNYYSRRVPKNNPAPEPDGRFDERTPWWWNSTVMAWDDSRPKSRAVVAASP